MKNKDFIQQLKEYLPLWIEKGWIAPKYQENILNSVTLSKLNKKDIGSAHSIFALMGVILIAIALLSFFAANWQMMNKISKLFILFGLMTISYVLAGYLLNTKKDSLYWTRIAHFLLFLGVVCFGVNIWQIAVIYHIDAHFPNGILLWSLGCFLVAFLLRSEFCMILAILLSLIWSFTESSQFLRAIHWPFLIIFILYLAVTLQEQWKNTFRILLLGLMFWLFTNLFWLEVNHDYFNTIKNTVHFSYVTFTLNMYILGSIITLALSLFWYQYQQKKELFAKILQHYAMFFLLFNFFLLTTPDFLEFIGLSTPSLFWVTIVFALLTCIILLKIQGPMMTRIKQFKFLTIALFSVIGLMLVLNHFISHFGILAIIYNVLMLALILWGIGLGSEFSDRIFINLSFCFFAIWIFARYFDVFWGLLNRSLFFALGGILLISVSLILERKRKMLLKPMITQNGNNI